MDFSSITMAQVLYLCAGIVAIIACIEKIKKPFDKIKDSLDKLTEQEENKKTEMASLKNDLSNLSTEVQKQGDMIYQMLDHMATSNNTGNMKKCLDEYNEYNRHS